LFIWLPQFVRTSLENIFTLNFELVVKNLIEGGVKVLIFVLYIILCSLLKDIKRTYMYHGAEHKTITCYEKGLDLTVENARKCTRIHDRCGTMFLILVVLVSIIIFACFEGLVGKSIDGYVRVLCKILLLPLTAGFSYEMLKLLAKTDSWVFYPFKIPGILLQKITTREPDDKMLEVAITSFKTVMEMDNDPSIPTVSFMTSKKSSDVLNGVIEELSKNGIEERAEAEWIVSIVANIKRDVVNSDRLIKQDVIDKINEVVKMRITGRPLWYCIGDTDFYGYTIKVDERVLIPRPETELLVEEALKRVSPTSRVLDLCTGSGAIAIALNKKSGAKVVAVDVSDEALCLASENAKLNDAEITFVKSDLFTELNVDENFNVIVSNPPYIKSEDILTLQNEVKNFEPRIALDGGVDGLDFYRKIATESRKFLTENGILLLEVGISQTSDVKNLLSDFSEVQIIKDYENIERIVVAVV
jgi:release factor-specific protein-(glutamine-N5) methyltransferase